MTALLSLSKYKPYYIDWLCFVNVKLVVNATMKKCSGKPAAYSKIRPENDVSIGAYSASW